ncbi:MAG: hypothetical protein JXN61_09885 [Sedimentisphaerales bacterium]|nr:hypothetical protein [Sedimentisphaerales bacterium]
MRHILLLLATTVLILASPGCEKNQSDNETQIDATTVKESPKNEKPLLLDDEHPLLLDDPAAGLAVADMADNSRCFVCHINYAQEEIAVIHARQDMGCAHCHGESDEHIADESWASGGNGTAPDKIYTKDHVNPFCLGCHSKDKLPEEPHKPVFADSNSQKHCTDCHGEHLLKERKTKWK